MATRDQVPRANGEGSIGTATKKWLAGHFVTVYADNLNYTIPDATDAIKGIVELATGAETITGANDALAVTPAGLAQLTSTTSRAGLVELSTPAEAVTGLSETLAVTPAGLAAAIADADMESIAAVSLNYTVGSAGNFPTLNAALAFLSTLRPKYSNSPVTATLTMLSGFVMQEQVLVRSIDFGWVTILGQDAQTNILVSALTNSFGLGDYQVTAYPAFGVSGGGCLPRIGQLFNMNTAGTKTYRHGLLALGAGSRAEILAASGFTRAAAHGIYADYGAAVNASMAILTESTQIGAVAVNGSRVIVSDAQVTGSIGYSIYATQGGSITAFGTNATRSGTGTTSDYVLGTGGTIVKNSGRGTADTNISALNSPSIRGIIFGS